MKKYTDRFLALGMWMVADERGVIYCEDWLRRGPVGCSSSHELDLEDFGSVGCIDSEGNITLDGFHSVSHEVLQLRKLRQCDEGLGREENNFELE